MTRGRRGSLGLRRRALPSPPPGRFIPAHAPSLQPHYRTFAATTSRPAPVPRLGTLPLAVSAARGPPSRSQQGTFTLIPWPSLSGRQVLLFRASARDELTPPLHRAPPGQHAGHSPAEGTPLQRAFVPGAMRSRRVARGISAPGPHRSGREPLDSSGSCHPVIRSCTATTSAQTGQVTVSGPPSAMPAPVHRYVPVACTSPSPTSSDGDPYAYLWASPQSDRTR